MFGLTLNKSGLLTSHLLCRASLFSSLMLAASVSSAVAPVEANFILGMDVQGQRLNLYHGCGEGSVTCDDMLLVAPDLGRLLQTEQLGKRHDKSPYAVKLYPAKTKHSLCKDGVTPCGFQGYIFKGGDFNGFIDPENKELYIASNWTTDSATVSYKENPAYLPLASQAERINKLYSDSDKKLNNSYRVIHNEVKRLYGKSAATDLYKEQIAWIKLRTSICGADINHLPITQAEKVCFIQENSERMEAYFLWID